MNTVILCVTGMDLLQSVQHEELDRVRHVVKQGESTDSENCNGESALFVACENGHYDVVEFLLKNGTSTNYGVKMSNRNHPLLVACKWRHHQIVKLLLENGADIQATDENKKSALYYAVESIPADDSDPDLSTVNLLLDCGADTNATTLSGKTPLYAACLKGLTATVQRMMECGADVNANRYQYKKSPLNGACKSNNAAVVELLLKSGADPNIPEETRGTARTMYAASFALHIAAARLNDEFVNMLLNYGAKVNTVDSRNNTALHHAVYGRVYTKGKYTNTPAASANVAKSQRVLGALLHAGADVNNIRNRSGDTSLYLAMEKDVLDFVHPLLSYVGNPNIPGNCTYLLNVACQHEDMTLVETLLKAGADPNLRFSDNALPLYTAIRSCNCELARLLLSYGVDVNVNISYCLGETPLKAALDVVLRSVYGTRDSRAHVVSKMVMPKLLLEHGADVNQVSRNGKYPLHWLLESCNTRNTYCSPSANMSCIRDLFQMLINRGADLDFRNNILLVQLDFRIVKALCIWCSTDWYAVDLLKAGAAVKILALCYKVIFEHAHANSIRLCQAAVMAGYRPSSAELDDLRQSVSAVSTTPVYAQLLSWLNEDGEKPASLMRQCRVTIRRQLSLVSHHRTILPAIDQLPLPACLQQYLKFEGSYNEIDFGIQAHISEEETRDTHEETASCDHTYESDTDEHQRADCDDSVASEDAGEDGDNLWDYDPYDYRYYCDSDNPSSESSEIDNLDSQCQWRRGGYQRPGAGQYFSAPPPPSPPLLPSLRSRPLKSS